MRNPFRKKKPKIKSNKKYLTVKEVADYLDISKSTIYNYKYEGLIEFKQFKPYGKIWIPKEELKILKSKQ